MKLPLQNPASGRESGYGILVVMSLLAVLLIVFVSLLSWSTTNSRITTRNILFNESENAAESSTENILAYMMRDFNYGNLGSEATYETNSPQTNGWPVYFKLTATNGDSSAVSGAYASVSIGQLTGGTTNLSSQFAGLYGFLIPCTVACKASPQELGQSMSATVVQDIQFAVIPLFQFAIFYNMDLEINPGAGMKVNGHVHSNGNIWATGAGSGSSQLVFNNYVEAAEGVFERRSTNDPSAYRSGNVSFTITNNNPLAKANVLTLPVGASSGNNNPTNVLAILNPPPYNLAPPNYSAAYLGAGSNYLENEADLLVSNTVYGTNGIAIVTTNGMSTTNIFVWYQNPQNNPNYLLFVQPDVMVTNSITTNAILGVSYTNTFSFYSFVTNATFYDYRQSATVRAAQINVTNLDLWLANTNAFTNSLGVFHRGYYYNQLKTTGPTAVSSEEINSIYVYNSIKETSSVLPAVRVVNGMRLPPSGLTVATPQPLYVMGDYNVTTNGTKFSWNLGDTTNTVPAALIGDAVTILSSNWKDYYTGSTLLSTRIPVNTTINAATLEGIVPSNGTYYSGGVENFLRLLEAWGGTLTYNGSIVVMFPSQYATAHWAYGGNIYYAPTRNWGFDVNFNNASLLPPLTPKIKGTIRGAWAAY